MLQTDAERCKVCGTGDVTVVNRDRSEESFVIYTRDGTVSGVHKEYRCNNRKNSCRAGHYYGYVTLGEKSNSAKPRCYEREALKKKYLVTSNQTAFSVSYLWDCLLQIVFSNASFESLAKVYNNLHFINLPTDVMLRRIEVNRKRIADAVFLFAYLELGQRYGLPPIIHGGVDETILKTKTDIRDKFRKVWSVNHHCDVKGCDSVLIIDGGMKPTRSLCAAKLHGLREFNQSGMVVVCGCQRAPLPNSKYCGEHVGISSPAITSDKVSTSTRQSLREHRTATSSFKEALQDNIYVIETLLEKKVKNKEEFWKVKWLGFPPEQSTWEPAANIQPWILSYYEKVDRLGLPLPEPRIKYSKKAGDEVYYYLSWEGGEDQTDRWVGKSFFSLAAEDGEIVSQLEEDKSCNTKKTKDKRERRHTVGIMVGTKPCGIVTLFDELYGSESLTQVYGMLVEHISRLPESARRNLKDILYDDACHLKKFSENEKRANKNDFTRFLASVPKHVDNFHFKNHVDPWCHRMCNPKDARSLDGVNTESCEQTFKWVNKFTSVKSMNESRFFLFFTVIFDLHNLQKNNQLRSHAHPGSPLRWELLPDQRDYEATLLEIPVATETAVEVENEVPKVAGNTEEADLASITNTMKNLEINQQSLICDDCGAVYKKPWTLKNHMKKKHGKDSTDISTAVFVCDDCKEVFLDSEELSEHRKTHWICKICGRACDSNFLLKRHMKSHRV